MRSRRVSTSSSRPGRRRTTRRGHSARWSPRAAGTLSSRSSSPTACSSGDSARERSDRAPCVVDERNGALTLLGSERLQRGGRALDELGDAAQACALAPQRLVVARLEPLGVREPASASSASRACSPPASRSSCIEPASLRPSARATPSGSRRAASPVLDPGTHRACRAETRVVRDGAARTARTSRSAARSLLPDPPVQLTVPTRRRGCARRRRPGERARAPPRRRAAARRAPARSSSSQNPAGTSNSAST